MRIGGEIVDAVWVPKTVVVIDQDSDVRLEVSRQMVAFEQDAVLYPMVSPQLPGDLSRQFNVQVEKERHYQPLKQSPLGLPEGRDHAMRRLPPILRFNVSYPARHISTCALQRRPYSSGVRT